MSFLWMSIVVLLICLCAFVYLTFQTMPALSLRHQRRTLAFVVLAGLIFVVAQLRHAVWGIVAEGNLGFTAMMKWSMVAEFPAALCLLLAAHSLRRSEKHEVSPLRRSANLDPLTSLLNLGYFKRAAARRMAQATTYGMPVSLAMLDLDDFGSYNDAHGHEAGNAVLRIVADILRRSVRADDLVARYGGEEFVVLLNCDEGRAETALERIRERVEKLCSPEGGQAQRRITVSIGLAGTNETRRAVEELIESADRALHKAKRSGKNRITTPDEAA